MISPTYTVVIAHFGDVFWIQKTIDKSGLANHQAVKRIYIIDQNYGDQQLRKWAREYDKIQLREFPQKGTGNAHHAGALNQFIINEFITSSHLIVMDSDLIAQDPYWLDKISSLLKEHDACIALDPISDYLSHPCFMALPKPALAKLDFMEGMKNLRVDTGRLIGVQLDSLGLSISLLKPTPGFGGQLGYNYLDGSLFHVTSISIRQQPSRQEGKSALWISLADSWRRWVVFSNLDKRNNKQAKYIFLMCRIMYAALFVMKRFRIKGRRIHQF